MKNIITDEKQPVQYLHRLSLLKIHQNEMNLSFKSHILQPAVKKFAPLLRRKVWHNVEKREVFTCELLVGQGPRIRRNEKYVFPLQGHLCTVGQQPLEKFLRLGPLPSENTSARQHIRRPIRRIDSADRVSVGKIT